MNTQTILSICIPTFNRGIFLRKTLESITAQAAFFETDEIEIVISDNCSDDDTQSVSVFFATAFPEKVKYSRNSVNVGAEMNFQMALALGRGTFLKLHNDNLWVKNGSLAEIVKVIKATEAEKPIIFLTNGNKYAGSQIGICNNFDEFVKSVSFFSTWIGGFGIWREEFEAFSDFSINANLRLIQTDVTFKLLAKGKRALVLYDAYFSGIDTGLKGGYNIAEVFGKNYLSLLKKYLSLGILTQETYEIEKKSILINHIIPYYFDKNNGFSKNGFFIHMQDYLHNDYFYKALEGLIFEATPDNERSAPKEFTISQYWRHLNSHNETEIVKFQGRIDFTKITVGRKTYGGLSIWNFGHEDEKLTIGNFVSIADDVKFLLGGGHSYDGLSTFPFLTKYFATLESTTKGPIVVNDDVWIGYGSTVLSGVTIGQGAIIAAGSIVTSDVSAYSIVGGNPAKLIKYRFEKKIIEKLCSFDFSMLSDDAILRSRDVLYTTITPENVDSILSRIARSQNP